MGEDQSATENTADSQVMSIQSTNGSFTPIQIAVMSVAVIWGFVGTALYFAKGTKQAK
jgi:hypothetical protein